MRRRSGRGTSARGVMRPRIGITGLNAVQLKNYIEAVEAAGGEAVPLTPGAGSGDAVLNSLDGLVLSGGKDIDPELYGQQLQPGLGVDVDAPRDALEIPLARRALERDLPVLGICRGIQVLNVAAGGTLLQDIVLAGAGRATHNQREITPEPPEDAAMHEVTITPGSRLAESVGGERLGGNTFNHQVLDKPAPWLAGVAGLAVARGARAAGAVVLRARAIAPRVQR